MTTAALPEDVALEASAPVPSREDMLERYHRLREISIGHHSEVMAFVSADTIFQQARRLGLTSGKSLVADSLEEFQLAVDLAIYTAPADRTRAIDRYARSGRCAPGSEEAMMLEAMRNARFGILVAKRRHPSVGLIVTDVFRERELWLVDLGLEASFPMGAAIACRYFASEPFIMNSGGGVPLDSDLITGALKSAPSLMRKAPVDLVEDRRFAEAIYRAAISEGATARMQFRDSHELDEDAA